MRSEEKDASYKDSTYELIQDCIASYYSAERHVIDHHSFMLQPRSNQEGVTLSRI